MLKKSGSKSLWGMAEEQIKAQTPKCFKQVWMGIPFEQQHDAYPVIPVSPSNYRPPATERQQPEDRMCRAFVVPFKVEVFNDASDEGALYTVHATSALDARCMAFVLDGGCQLGLKHWDDGHIELALSHTKVIG